MDVAHFYILGSIASFFLLSSCNDGKICEKIVCTTDSTVKEIDGKCECVNENDEENIVKTGFIKENETWTADNIYEIKGKVIVKIGVTLTITSGTIIKGAHGTGSSSSALIVSRGAKIEACGTAESPIIMTSISDNIKIGEKAGTNLDESQTGLWGGLIVLGSAPGSFESDVNEFQIEGIPANDEFGLYGGNDSADDSGSLCYISIRHGGATIGANNEINGLTLGCVGSATKIENIEIVANQDDGIEFFGGTVNVTNALVWAQGDDAFDVDQAYSGTLDNFVYIAGASSDHGLEIDGPEGSAEGRFTFQNGSLKGFNDQNIAGDLEIADFRASAMGVVKDCKIFNFPDHGDLEIDDDKSSANYFANKLEIKGLQFMDVRSVSDVCTNKSPLGDESAFDAKMERNNSQVTTTTVGASIEMFSWTFAASKKALDGF